MAKFREILRLHELGYSQCAIAQSCAVARSTVQAYVRRATAKNLSYEQLRPLSDAAVKELLGKGKCKETQPVEPMDFAAIALELQRKGVTLALLWQEGLDKGQWQMSYGTFCRRYNQWRIRQQLSLRQVYKGGEKLFVDYCGLTVPVVQLATGEVTLAQVFVACLGASNYTYAEATPTQALAHWLGSHQRALTFFGGVPECIVPDNLKAGVTDPCRYEPGIIELRSAKRVRSYQEFAEHYGIAILPARPKKPRDKAKVEKAVQEVERQILAPLRHEAFTSFTALNAAIAQGLQRLNSRVMHGYGLSRQGLFEQVDQPALQPLPALPFVVGHWKSAKVNVDYHIEVEHHYYSVPYTLVTQEVQVKVSEQLIEIFHQHQRIACHARSRLRYRHTTIPEHMPPEHLAYKQQSKERFLAWAEQIGVQTNAQVQAVFASKAHEEQAFRSLKGLQRLSQRYHPDRVEAACRRANAFGLVGLRRLRTILENQLDQVPLPETVPPSPVTQHPNVRGSHYYH